MGYVISFAIGASLVTLCLWIALYIYKLQRLRSFTVAYHSLPGFHITRMWLAGGTSGLLWSIGNFFSILSVKYLGEAVGYSVVQAAMIFSGLWGIFYFGEVTGAPQILRWFLSAFVTVSGILLLSHEHG